MIEFNFIGKVRCGFKEKFGIPRQPGLCPNVPAQVILEKTRFNEEAVRELDMYSHIWIIFHFHLLKKIPDKARIRPPRLGGNQYVGLYSSRSPYRPNPIGLSLVQLEGIEFNEKEICLNILSHDLHDGTPVLDIKPFISTDVPSTEVNFGWQSQTWQTLEVQFADGVETSLENQQIISQVLQQDPRPAYDKKKENNKTYHMTLNELNISFNVHSRTCVVTCISNETH
jgi:tRNA (adenine37-N6)-methyltransferase